MRDNRPTLFITDVKTISSTKDTLEYFMYNQKAILYDNEHKYDDPYVDYVVVKELIRARSFVTPTGRVMNVGLSKDVQEALGVVFGAFDKMDHDLRISQKCQRALFKKLNDANLEICMQNDIIADLRRSWCYRIQKTVREYLEML